MAITLTTTAELLSQQVNIQQQIILEIDGIPLVFGAVKVTKLAKYGDDIDYGDAGLVYGGSVVDPRNRDLISLDGTSNRIQQQIDPDKEGASSVQKLIINLIDKDGELTNKFAPGVVVDDVLGRKADVFVAFQGANHPEDSIKILNGLVDNIEFGAGNVKVTVSHPQQLQRSDLFQQVNTTITSGIDGSTLTIPIDDATGLFEPADIMKSYLRIEDELIEIASIAGSTVTATARGALGTTAVAHPLDAEVTSFYRLESDPIDIALKLMLSGDTEPYASDIDVPNFVQVTPTINLANSIFVTSTIFQDQFGLSVGDTVTITGATNGANNVVDAPILSFTENPTGTIITLSGVSLVSEVDSSAVMSLKSQFNVLPDGAGKAGLDPRGVDVEQHLFIKQLFSTSLPDYDIYLKDTINAKDFLSKDIYFPAGLFPVPRKGRNSVNITIPPLAQLDTKVLDIENVQRPDNLKIKRSINKDFYNAVTYRYQEDELEDEFKRGVVTQSARSTNRIKTVNKPLVVDAKGLRDTGETDLFIERQTRRFVDRFQFGAESINVTTNYKTGFNVDVGDISILQGEELKISDQTQGSRSFQTRLMEVTNKRINLRTGRVDLELTDTAFGADARFGVFSPSSFIGSGATTSELPLKDSFFTPSGQLDRDKWSQYVGQNVTIHSPDYSTQETTVFVGFSPTNPNVILINPALGFTPSEDDIIDVDFYPTSINQNDNILLKSVHCFASPEVDVVSGASGTVFDVGAGDIGKFFVGSLIRVHSLDFTSDSTTDLIDDDAEVIDITGTTITVNRDLGFTPTAGQVVNLIGFADEGLAYRYV